VLHRRCEPGTPLSALPESEQDLVIGTFCDALASTSAPHPFRPLSEMLSHGVQKRSILVRLELVREGMRLIEELGRTAPAQCCSHRPARRHVLRAQREPWLVIDPKPFIGDPAYDAHSTC
jgi:streptomycin 6-kinase